MKSLTNLRRELKEAFISFKRNGITSLGCIIISTIALLSLGITILISVYGNYATASIGERLKVTAFFKPSATEEEISEVVLKAKSIPQIKDVEFVSSERALEELKQNFKDLDTVETSSIPPSIRITPKNSNDVKKIIEEISNFTSIASITDVSKIADSYFKMVRIVYLISISIIIFFFTGFVFMIASATSLAIYSFRKEIEIMQLIGSSRGYVRNPFLFLGGFYGLIGGVISSLFMYSVSKEFDKIYKSFIFYVPIEFNSLRLLLIICLTVLLVGILGGVIASTISVRRYLR
jgi:cell division transport system permease protein